MNVPSRDNLLIIFQHLSFVDLCSASRACSLFRDVIQTSTLWKSQCILHGISTNSTNWKSEFINYYKSPLFLAKQVVKTVLNDPDAYHHTKLTKLMTSREHAPDIPLVLHGEIDIYYPNCISAANNKLITEWGNQIFIHNIDTGELLHEIPVTEECGVYAVDISKSEDFACSGGGGNVASVYSLREEKPKKVFRKFEHPCWVVPKFVGNNLITICDNNHLGYFDVVGNERLFSIEFGDEATNFVVSPTDENIVAVSAETSFQLIDLRIAQATIKETIATRVNCFHPSGNLLSFADIGDLYDIRNFTKPAHTFDIKTQQRYPNFHFSPSGLLMYTTDENGVVVYDVITGKIQSRLFEHLLPVSLLGNEADIIICHEESTSVYRHIVK